MVDRERAIALQLKLEDRVPDSRGAIRSAIRPGLANVLMAMSRIAPQFMLKQMAKMAKPKRVSGQPMKSFDPIVIGIRKVMLITLELPEDIAQGLETKWTDGFATLPTPSRTPVLIAVGAIPVSRYPRHGR